MANSFNVGLSGKADVSSRNIAVRSSSGVSNFGFRFSEESHSSPNKKSDILEIDDKDWDEQIKVDFLAGKFNQLVKKAREEFTQGKAVEI
jgi:hypothetical protein